MSTGGATTGRRFNCSAAMAPPFSLRMILLSLMALAPSGSWENSSAGLHCDLPGLALGGLRQGHGQHAVLQLGVDLVGGDLVWQGEAARKAGGLALLAVHRVPVGGIALALAADGQDILGRRKLDVLV